MASITDLPIEILLKIFQFYSQIESQKMLLGVIRNVCGTWKNVCLDNSLWKKFDGTPSFKDMMYLSKIGSLKNTKELIISSTECFGNFAQNTKNCNSSKSIRETKNFYKESFTNRNKRIAKETEFFQSVKNVEVISFSKVEQMSDETLSILAQNCTKLREIKIGILCRNQISLSYKNLVDFFSMRGCGIKKIDFSYCKLPIFPRSMRCIADCCPNLEYLHLMNIYCSQGGFPTGYFQMRCSKLKSLYMDDNIKIDISKHPTGFPDLEEFVYCCQERISDFEKEFKSILFNSPKLKFLSLTNCYVSSSFMLSLPASSVQYLYIPKTKACSDESLGDLLKKWSHSLKEIDLSHGSFTVQNAVLKLIKTPMKSPLEFLNLNFTPVNVHLVENVLKYCSRLKTLKLEGCRSLLRGMKRTYSNKCEFEELAKKISSNKSILPLPETFIIKDP